MIVQPDISTAAQCATCGGCRVASLTWLGSNRWRTNPCPDCATPADILFADLPAVQDEDEVKP